MKNLICMVMFICILLSASEVTDIIYANNKATDSAVTVQVNDLMISPKSVYTQYTYTTLSITSDVAYSSATIMGYSGLTTSVSITIHLEKKVLWWWSIQETWTQTFSGYTGTLSESLDISSGRYRVRAVYTAYSGSNSETITGISSEVVN